MLSGVCGTEPEGTGYLSVSSLLWLCYRRCQVMYYRLATEVCFVSLVFSWVLFHFLLLWLMTSVFVGKLLIVLLGAKKKEPTEKRQM